MNILKYHRFFLCLIILIVATIAIPVPASAQSRGIVKGRLTDAAGGEPLMFANVVLKGTSTGTVTDDDGNYLFPNLRPGSYTLLFSYLSYHDMEQEIEVVSGETLVINGILEMASIMGEEVVITGMMRGQTAAINQQITSNTIVNVVSKEKIRELPDANAAEAIARLPGISLQRDAGEGTKVVIRGLAPKFNSITMNGERIPSTDPVDRSVDLSMISPDMLEGMEVYKALRPDMDGDAIGGTVNFLAKDADPGFHGSALLQTGYNSHANEFGQYKVMGSLGNRFFEDKFGVLVTGNFQRANRSSHLLDGSYVYKGEQNGKALIGVSSLNLADRQEIRYRGGVSATLDYKLPKGEIFWTSAFNSTDRDEVRRRKRYGVDNNTLHLDLRDRDITTNLFTTNLSGKHFLQSLEIHWRGSLSQSVQNPPFYQYGRFRELAAFTDGLNELLRPETIPQYAKNNLDETFFKDNYLESGKSTDLNYTAQLDLSHPYGIGGWLKGLVKVGVKMRHKDRGVEKDIWWTSHFGINNLAAEEPDQWDRTPQGKLAVSNFIDPNTDLNPWLEGRYDFSPALDGDKFLQWGRDWRDYVFPNGDNLYIRDPRALLEVYTAKEDIYAGYIMTEINIGKYIMILPGVRYEQTKNNYKSTFGNPFESEDGGENVNIGGLTDTTGGQDYKEFLPMIHFRVKPVDWFDLRLAYTKTLSRPDYYNLVPWREVSRHETYVHQGNPALLHTTAYNYDAFASFYNKLGMFTFGFFYKEIENIDYIRTSRIQEEGDYFGFHLTEPVNSIGTSTVKGIEIELQTNFRYLPRPFDGIVLYANYSRMFSQTEFPYLYLAGYESTPPFRSILVDTIRLGRMPGQVDYVGNISLGYEKGGFSGRVSLIIQGPSLQFVGTRHELDGFNGSFARWDMVLRQKIGKRFSVYFNLNNFTNYSESSYLGSTRYPTREELYGWTADIGVRYVF